VPADYQIVIREKFPVRRARDWDYFVSASATKTPAAPGPETPDSATTEPATPDAETSDATPDAAAPQLDEPAT
jgi:hypothetical protein